MFVPMIYRIHTTGLTTKCVKSIIIHLNTIWNFQLICSTIIYFITVFIHLFSNKMPSMYCCEWMWRYEKIVWNYPWKPTQACIHPLAIISVYLPTQYNRVLTTNEFSHSQLYYISNRANYHQKSNFVCGYLDWLFYYYQERKLLHERIWNLCNFSAKRWKVHTRNAFIARSSLVLSLSKFFFLFSRFNKFRDISINIYCRIILIVVLSWYNKKIKRRGWENDTEKF